jgi:phosphatidate cytidylyltransferase
MAANVATALPLDRADPKPSTLGLRIMSALVMAPVALAAVWLGGWWLAALVLLITLGMCWEWARLTSGDGFGATGIATAAAGVISVGSLLWGVDLGAALGLAFAGSIVVLAIAVSSRTAEPLWAAGGALWVTVGTVAFLWLGLTGGRGTLLWLLGIVWATDIGAYAAGRSIGGPKLAPRLSPNKTWSGLAGGVLSAALVGLIAAWLSGAPAAALALISGGLAVVAQLGDLAESHAKRHFGVKDSSNLIPGHGGLLDRLDGLLAASVVTGLAALVLGSSHGPVQ